MGRATEAGDGAGCSSETFTISVAVTGGAHSAGGVGERLLGAVVRVGVEVRAGVVEVVVEVEVEVEAGAEAWTGAESSAGAGGPVEAALGAAGLL